MAWLAQGGTVMAAGLASNIFMACVHGVQIHFFPIIFNGKQLYDVMEERCGETQNSGKR